jgi:hypothetical protein
MISWIKTTADNPKIIHEVIGASSDPVDVYPQRYLMEIPEPNPEFRVEAIWNELFCELEADSSVLLLGAGHSYWANSYSKFPNISRIFSMDYIEEAGIGLLPSIEFYCQDLLNEGITGQYDYIYSAHTIEHFTRDEVLNKILPMCLAAANKAVIFLIPYGTYWADEPSHKCHFYENDELAALADKYKIIRDGSELVLWFTNK